jgi:hypothetical protein
MTLPLTSTSRFLALNASPDELRRAIAEQAIWIERQGQTNAAVTDRLGRLESTFEDWQNDRKQADVLILAKLAAIDVTLQEIRTARSFASTMVKVALALASLAIAAKAAGIL